MLIHHLSGRTSEWCLASHHYPERYSKRVQIRTDVHANAPKLLGTRKLGVPTNAPGDEIPASEADSSSVFAKPRSIIFAVTPRSSCNLTIMFVGLISRWTRFSS